MHAQSAEIEDFLGYAWRGWFATDDWQADATLKREWRWIDGKHDQKLSDTNEHDVSRKIVVYCVYVATRGAFPLLF